MILQSQANTKTSTLSPISPLLNTSFDDHIHGLIIQIQQQVNPDDIIITKIQDGANKTYPLSLVLDEMAKKRVGLMGQPIVSLPQEKIQFYVGGPFIRIDEVIFEPYDFKDLLCAKTIQSLFYLCACERISKSQIDMALSMDDGFVSSEVFSQWLQSLEQLTDCAIGMALSYKLWHSLIEKHHDFGKQNFVLTLHHHHDLHHFKTFNSIDHISISISVETLKHWKTLRTWPETYQMLKMLATRYIIILDNVTFANDFMAWNQDGIFDMAQGPYVGAKVILLSNE